MKLPIFSTVLLLASALAPLGSFATESTALDTLAAPEASLHDKAMACDELGRVGTAKAVPVLATLLADPKLHDYARDGLERIPDPAAGKALTDALASLKGNLRVGTIISLGDRGEAAAVSALTPIAQGDSADPATGAALTALGQIATNDARQALLGVLKKGNAHARSAAAHAALLAAQQLEKTGKAKDAKQLRKAVAGAAVPPVIKQAAGK